MAEQACKHHANTVSYSVLSLKVKNRLRKVDPKTEGSKDTGSHNLVSTFQLITVQGGWSGCRTGNGEELSSSQACCLAQLCLSAA